MELALSLGDTPKPLPFLEKTHQKTADKKDHPLGFYMGLGPLMNGRLEGEEGKSGSSDPVPVQLDLLPLTPVQRSTQPPSGSGSHLPFPWLTANLLSGPGSSDGPGRDIEVNRGSLAAEEGDDGAALSSSPNSTVSSFQMGEFSMCKRSTGRSGKRDLETTSVIINEVEKENSRGSDEDQENGLMNRKKLRLSKDQSAFLEESFKEHTTLNPKQKLALAKQLNLRPRQVEVWFQNRRARTKLKQTEVDCEYLKKWCESLTEENRKLQKELQELRALKSTSQPFYMQRPATTLTMCPSCERVASTTAAASATAAAAATTTTNSSALANSKLHPFKQDGS